MGLAKESTLGKMNNATGLEPSEIVYEVNPWGDHWRVDKMRYEDCCICKNCQEYIFRNYWEAWAKSLQLTAEDKAENGSSG